MLSDIKQQNTCSKKKGCENQWGNSECLRTCTRDFLLFLGVNCMFVLSIVHFNPFQTNVPLMEKPGS